VPGVSWPVLRQRLAIQRGVQDVADAPIAHIAIEERPCAGGFQALPPDGLFELQDALDGAQAVQGRSLSSVSTTCTVAGPILAAI